MPARLGSPIFEAHFRKDGSFPMKKISSLGVVLLSLSLVAGCAKAAPPMASRDESALAAAPTSVDAHKAAGGEAAVGGKMDGLATGKNQAREQHRALIVTGEMHLSTKNVATASQTIRAEVERAGGYVSDAQENGSGEHRHAMLELRVPADKTRTIRAALKDLGEITSDVEKVEDVTDARADLKARLHNARIEEQRIKEIMQNKTAGLADVLAAERELARVREKIEQFEAQERTMEGKIALATIKVHLNGPAPIAKETEAWRTPGKSIGSAFHAGLKGTAALAVYAAMALAASSPITVPLGIVLALVFGIVRRKKQALAATHAVNLAQS